MAAQTPTVLAARRARPSQVAHDSDRDERVRIANSQAGPSPPSHGRATAKSTTSSNLLKKVNRVASTEFIDDDTMMPKRIQFELLLASSSCFMRTRAATDERPEPRAKPKSGRQRKLTRFLCGITCNREFMAHEEGEGRRSVSACSPHATPGRVKARRDGRRVRTFPRNRATPRAGISGGCGSRAERAAAHHSRETAGWGFAAAERSSRAFVCVLLCRAG